MIINHGGRGQGKKEEQDRMMNEYQEVKEAICRFLSSRADTSIPSVPTVKVEKVEKTNSTILIPFYTTYHPTKTNR